MKEQEWALLKGPNLRYLPAYIPEASEQHFSYYESASPEQRARLLSGYKMVQDFARRSVAAGGKSHSASAPDYVLAGYGVHAQFQLKSDAGLTPPQTTPTASPTR